MHRLRTTLTAALVGGALLATTAGCKDDKQQPEGSRTILGTGTGAPVDCTQIPYDYALDEQDPGGTGIVVQRGHIRGAIWVACDGVPTSFTISVVLKRNGLPYGTARAYAAIPNATGYAASVFEACTPGVYRVQYSYRWSANGGTAADTTTSPISETVTQHDCDS